MEIDLLSKQLYEQQDCVREYLKQDTLWPEEEVIFQKYEAHIRDRAVLDIGCGGGRTARFLGHLTKAYMGIDYSQAMVNACQEHFKGLTFRQCDASDMAIFDDETFDFVLFAFNGIDGMSHEKRMQTLSEIHRVLKYDGVFAFSTHNLDDKRIVTCYNIRDLNLFRNIRHIRSYQRAKKHQARTDSYAILSDPLAGFGQLSYYIRKQDQVKQLETAKFKNISILNQEVKFVNADSRDRKSQWIHFICRKLRSTR